MAYFVLLSGPADRSAEDVSIATEAAGPSVEERIRQAIRDENPRLSERKLHRITRAVMDNSEKYGLDPTLVVAVIRVESDAQPWARSPKGAVGLMQVMPHMAERFAIVGDLTRIESNIELGCLILSDNIRRLGEEDGISAYFWGNRIRGVSYLKRVQAERDIVRSLSQG